MTNRASYQKYWKLNYIYSPGAREGGRATQTENCVEFVTSGVRSIGAPPPTGVSLTVPASAEPGKVVAARERDFRALRRSPRRAAKVERETQPTVRPEQRNHPPGVPASPESPCTHQSSAAFRSTVAFFTLPVQETDRE